MLHEPFAMTPARFKPLDEECAVHPLQRAERDGAHRDLRMRIPVTRREQPAAMVAHGDETARFGFALHSFDLVREDPRMPRFQPLAAAGVQYDFSAHLRAPLLNLS